MDHPIETFADFTPQHLPSCDLPDAWRSAAFPVPDADPAVNATEIEGVDTGSG